MHTAHRRQYERRTIDISVQVEICESDRTQVAPLGGAAVPGRMTNVSGGGAQVVVSTFLPRSALVDLEIPSGSSVPAGRAQARVMSIRMIDREPHYALGLRFEQNDCELVRAIQAAEGGDAEADA